MTIAPAVGVHRLPARWVEQARADAAARQHARTRQGCDLYGAARDGGDEYLHHLEWHYLGRLRELAVEHFYGLPLLPDLPFGEHFDTHLPVAVQVKPMERNDSPVRLRRRRSLCGCCPYVFVHLGSDGEYRIAGWARLRDVVKAGRYVNYGDGASMWEAPQAVLQPMPEPPLALSSPLHYGPHSPCPSARTYRPLSLEQLYPNAERREV